MVRQLSLSGTLALLTALAACADRGRDARTFELSHLDPAQAQEMLEPYVEGGATNIRRSDRPRAVTVTASAERLEQIQDLLARYDVPAPNVQLRFQLIEANGFTTVDPAIADVEAALRDLFRFNGYRLVAESVISARMFSNTAQRLVGADGVSYSLVASVGSVASSGNSSSADISVELGAEGTGRILNTSVVVPGGQTVVLGSARPAGNRGALILVVRPTIQ